MEMCWAYPYTEDDVQHLSQTGYLVYRMLDSNRRDTLECIHRLRHFAEKGTGLAIGLL
jgi:hypothetical protein